MQKSIAQGFKVKAKMIAERELFLNAEEIENPSYFPKYLILRRASQQKGNELVEWEGFIKDLKVSMKQNQTKIKEQMDQMMHQVEASMKT